MKACMAGPVAALLVLLSSPAARAEEGLTVARLSGGVGLVSEAGADPVEIDQVGQTWHGALDLSLSPRMGAVGSILWVDGESANTLGIALAPRALLYEAMWQRIYLHAGPELVWVRRGEGRTLDVGARAGLGFEHILTWGFGYVIELHGAASLGRGDKDALDAMSAAVTAGLFMEF